MAAETPDIAIVGGGAAGVMLAMQLMRQGPAHLRVTLIDRSPVVGLGVAYSTDCSDHLLNVRADNMSVLPDEPAHFLRWLEANGFSAGCDDFVPRKTYGDYLRSVLVEAVEASAGRLSVVSGHVVAARQSAAGMQLELDDGAAIKARKVVLATGHQPPARDRGAYFGNPWCNDCVDGLDPMASVLIVGTSLTMVDVVLSLLERRHTGPMLAVSRRGLLPQTHPETQIKNPPCEVSVLFEGPLSLRLRRFRTLIETDSCWQDVLQKLRTRNTALWGSLDDTQKRRFMRHLRPWWDTHRHRLAPDVGRTIDARIASGQLTLFAGRIEGMDIGENAVEVRLLERGTGRRVVQRVDRVIDCSGPRNAAKDERYPLLAQMLDSGLAKADAYGLGLAVDADDAVLGRDGQPSEELFALGPPTRGRHWEIIAVPDIRERADKLAQHLIDALQAADTMAESSLSRAAS